MKYLEKDLNMKSMMINQKLSKQDQSNKESHNTANYAVWPICTY